MDELGHGISMFCVINRRSKDLFPRQLSETLVGLPPSYNRARNVYAMNAVLSHRRDSLLLQKINRQAARRPAAGIQAVEFPALRVPINQEEIAPNAVHHRLGDTEHSIGCNGRVNRRAPTRQNLSASLRRENMAGRDHSNVVDDHGTAGGTLLG